MAFLRDRKPFRPWATFGQGGFTVHLPLKLGLTSH